MLEFRRKSHIHDTKGKADGGARVPAEKWRVTDPASTVWGVGEGKVSAMRQADRGTGEGGQEGPSV